MQAKINHALPPLEAVNKYFSKERLFIYQIQMFVLCDWRHNIVKVIGIWYISEKYESTIYFSISFMVLSGMKLIFYYFLSNFDQIIINS